MGFKVENFSRFMKRVLCIIKATKNRGAAEELHRDIVVEEITQNFEREKREKSMVVEVCQFDE